MHRLRPRREDHVEADRESSSIRRCIGARCGRGQRSGDNRALTLLEALFVIAVIAVLIALLLPVSGPRRPPRIPKARMEIGLITAAIQNYDAQYGSFPVSDNASNLAARAHGDLTYGAASFHSSLAPENWKSDNSEIMAVLLDVERFANGTDTVNKGHRLNPQRTRFLIANLVTDTKSPGIGIDGVYRDPWGSPYIISLDMNNDGKCTDTLYRLRAVSQEHGADGFNDLTNSRDPGGAGDNFEFKGRVMVWSLGPDKSASASQAANAGVNRDNILSWKP